MNNDCNLTEDQIAQWIVGEVARETRVSPSRVDTKAPFESLGLDSMKIVTLVGALERRIGMELDATLLWEYTSISEVAKYLIGERNVI